MIGKILSLALGNPLPLLLDGGRSPIGKVIAALEELAARINTQGWIGIAATLALAWHGHAEHQARIAADGQAVRWYQQFRLEKNAFAVTVGNFMRARGQAEIAARGNVTRVDAEGRAVIDEKGTSYEARIAAARARDERLRASGAYRTAQGGARAADLPGVSRGSDLGQAAGQDGLPSDAMICTMQAIELDEVLKAWAAIARIKTSPAGASGADRAP